MTDIIITWTAPIDGGSEITKYVISVDDSSIDIFDPLQTTYTITGLTGGQQYTISITAFNKYGES
jgi:hypothetical protein